MASEDIPGTMVVHMLEATSTTKRRVLAFTSGPMVGVTKGNGQMGSSTDSVYTFYKMVKRKKDTGKMGPEQDGSFEYYNYNLFSI